MMYQYGGNGSINLSNVTIKNTNYNTTNNGTIFYNAVGKTNISSTQIINNKLNILSHNVSGSTNINNTKVSNNESESYLTYMQNRTINIDNSELIYNTIGTSIIYTTGELLILIIQILIIMKLPTMVRAYV